MQMWMWRIVAFSLVTSRIYLQKVRLVTLGSTLGLSTYNYCQWPTGDLVLVWMLISDN